MNLSFHRVAMTLLFPATLALSAQAANYNFDVLYSGNNNAALAGGSDNPIGQSIVASDSFLWTITAQGGAEWHVNSTAGYFPLMAFYALDSGARDGDWTLTLMNNGGNVFTTSEVNSVQQFVIRWREYKI